MTDTGLTQQQAKAYRLLLKKGAMTASKAAQELKLSRTNAYKLLDKLTEVGIVVRTDNPKVIYSPAHPSTLSDYVYRYRAEATAREEAVNNIMRTMLNSYYEHSNKPKVETYIGKESVGKGFRKQLSLKQDVYFIHSKSDINQMGFNFMHEIRIAPSRHNLQRFGILAEPGGTNPKINTESHKRSNLHITWIKQGLYNTPVEWSATESSVLIVNYSPEPQAVLVMDKTIAASFIQLWNTLKMLLEKEPTHKMLTKN